MDKTVALEKIAKRLRIHSLKMTTEAGSGHPSTCLSMAELVACLFFGEMLLVTSSILGYLAYTYEPNTF